MSVTHIGIGPRYGNTCCSCCTAPPAGTPGVPIGANIDSCYCNCCACVPTEPLCFEMINCRIQGGGGGGGGSPCMCDDFSFTMDKSPAMCYYHTDGELNPGGALCTVCLAEYQDQPTGAYIEAWGFSGTVCGDCTTSSPPMSGSDCDGMCITASLCCCKTGIQVTGLPLGFDHPCPQLHPNGPCATEGDGIVTGAGPLPCSSHCFWFEIEPCSVPCSPCAYYTGTEEWPQLTEGSLSNNNCANLVSGQCKGTDGQKFMLLVEGEFLINCDCQTGWLDPDPSMTPPIQPVVMQWSGLITEGAC